MLNKYIGQEKRAQINNIINESQVTEIKTWTTKDNQNTINNIRLII